MDVRIRVFRILMKLGDFSGSDKLEHASSPDGFGEFLGRYANSGLGGPAVDFFSKGVSWASQGTTISVAYQDLKGVELQAGKESLGLELLMRDGKGVLLPIGGRRGRFFDSSEVLRFFSRIIEDQKSSS